MITDEQHPEMLKALKSFAQRVHYAVEGEKVTKPLIDKLTTVIREHRSEWRARGVDFPQMVILCIPRLGTLDFARADLDLPSIKTKIVNLVRSTPGASMEEIVNAFKAAYPDLKPGDVIEQHKSGVDADARQRERQARIQREVNQQIYGNPDGSEADTKEEKH